MRYVTKKLSVIKFEGGGNFTESNRKSFGQCFVEHIIKDKIVPSLLWEK
jgi:hypothetical protein